MSEYEDPFLILLLLQSSVMIMPYGLFLVNTNELQIVF